ncbi:MAG TPA: nicotinate-nicotinamide nucleotide adenylyltransferase [Candidatus Paceibacterota bacterium]|nr:nicotinate-nicotinamide nucleotide adenylyltransferase [Candidatus Paceibacterota bacterium]
MKKKRIALFGGAFNPPHNGHAAVVRALESLDSIDEIWLMPSANRWDKSISVSGPDRLHMIDLLIGDLRLGSNKHVRPFDHEIRKPNLSTTFETKAELEKLYPYHEFHFVFGSDVLPDIAPKWVHGKELFDTANFIFVERPGYVLPEGFALPPHAILLPLPHKDTLSSTHVRDIANDPDKLAACVSPSVAEFILKKDFYARTSASIEKKKPALKQQA